MALPRFDPKHPKPSQGLGTSFGYCQNLSSMENTLIKHLGHETPCTFSELRRHLKLAPKDESMLQRSLRNLELRGLVVPLKGGRYLGSHSPALVAGRIQITKTGRAFLAPDDPSVPEIAIPANETGTALNDDKALVFLRSLCASFQIRVILYGFKGLIYTLLLLF